MFRLIFLTFFGKPRYDEHHVHVHESPESMLGPLVILAVLSIVGGWVAAPGVLGRARLFRQVPRAGLRRNEAGRERSRSRRARLELTARQRRGHHRARRFRHRLLALPQAARQAGTARQIPQAAFTPRLLNKYYVDELYAAADRQAAACGFPQMSSGKWSTSKPSTAPSTASPRADRHRRRRPPHAVRQHPQLRRLGGRSARWSSSPSSSGRTSKPVAVGMVR